MAMAKEICAYCSRVLETVGARTLDKRVPTWMRERKFKIPAVFTTNRPTDEAKVALLERVLVSKPGKDILCPACATAFEAMVPRLELKPGSGVVLTSIRPLTEVTLKPAATGGETGVKPDPQRSGKGGEKPAEPKQYEGPVQVARAIKDGKRLRFARPMHGLTPCIVAVNSDACDTWADYREMRTLRPPKRGSVARFAFCPDCQLAVERCVPGEFEFGPTLHDELVELGVLPRADERPIREAQKASIEEGPKPEAAVHRVSADTGDGDSKASRRPRPRVSATRPADSSGARTSNGSALALCTASGTTGNPYEGLLDVPVFDPALFTTEQACMDALGDPRYDELVIQHANAKVPRTPVGKLNRASDVWNEAKAAAKECPLHGAEVRVRGRFQFELNMHVKKNFPDLRKGGKKNGEASTGTLVCRECRVRVNLLFDPVTHQPLRGKDAEGKDVLGTDGVCGRCSERLKRQERRRASAAADKAGKSAADKKKNGKPETAAALPAAAGSTDTKSAAPAVETQPEPAVVDGFLQQAAKGLGVDMTSASEEDRRLVRELAADLAKVAASPKKPAPGTTGIFSGRPSGKKGGRQALAAAELARRAAASQPKPAGG